MRPSIRCLHNLQATVSRAKSTSFIGLGRMGYEMAYNLFSKQYVQDKDARFVVCDAVPETAHRFCHSFASRFPDAQLEVVNTPKE